MPQYVLKPTILTTSAIVKSDSNGEFVNWQAEMNAAIAAFPGFVSLEFLSPTKQYPGWLIVQRFNENANIESWRGSEQWKSLKEKLQALTIKDGVIENETDPATLNGGVTEVIITQVSPDHLSAYRNWTAKIHQIEAKFPGFRGVYVQSPNQIANRHWITLLQFDTIDNLDRWLTSTERKNILNESEPMITSLESHRVISPYAGWFANIAKGGNLPPAWKQTMIVLLVLFPIVMLEMKYLNPLIANLNSSLATFIGNAISVALISFPAVPIVIWFLTWWLSPSPEVRVRNTILGTVLVILLYLLEIAVFWKFL